ACRSIRWTTQPSSRRPSRSTRSTTSSSARTWSTPSATPSRPMGVLGSIDRGLTRLVSWIAQALLWSAVAAGFYQVLARFVLESPSAWSEGWTRAAIIWTVMLGVALAFRQGAMLGVDLLHNLLAPRRARVLEHVVLLIVVGFLGFLVWIGADMTWRVRFQTTPSMGISISWIYLSIPVGATLALFAALAYWAEGPRRPHIETV